MSKYQSNTLGKVSAALDQKSVYGVPDRHLSRIGRDASESVGFGSAFDSYADATDR